MSEALDSLVATLQQRFGETLTSCVQAYGEVTVEVAPAAYLEVCAALRDEAEFRFEELIDLCGVDYAAYGNSEWEGSELASESGFGRGVERGGAPVGAAAGRRFAVVLHLLSVSRNQRLRLRCFGADNDFPVVPSLVGLWSSANWYEREAFDMFGLVFEGHPDLRRLLTDYGFVGHPFRKDFPLSGQVEMRYDPEQRRVIYEPVQIEPRVLVPRVIREDHRYLGEGVPHAKPEAK